MPGFLTLAHLSDVHLAPLPALALRHWNVKRGLGYLNWKRSRIDVHQRTVLDKITTDLRTQAPDHIAVTGDIANLGLPAEYAAGRAWLEELGSPSNVSVVPGNHDIYSGQMFGASCLTAWAPYMKGEASGAIDDATPFPYVRRLRSLVLIGVNSAVPTPPFVAAGRVGPEQLDALGKILQRFSGEAVTRVVLIHHPPLPGQAPRLRALSDAQAMRDVLKTYGAELVLHGHNHTNTLVLLKARAAASIPVCGIGSASAAVAHGDEPLACYALYRFEVGKGDGKPPVIRRIGRGLAVAGGPIIELSNETLLAPQR